MRILQSMAGAFFITLLLFIFMNSLVSGGQKRGDSGDAVSLQDFVRVARQERLETKQRQVPKKPEPPKRPDTPQQISQQDQVQKQTLNIDLPKIDVPYGGAGGGMFIPAGGGAASGGFGDGDLIPIVRIEPQWPREALINGIAGYVKLSFTVLEDGSVDPGSVTVVESKPPRLFDSSAKRAVSRWKFKPRIVDGHPVRRPAEQTIAYNLEDEDKK